MQKWGAGLSESGICSNYKFLKNNLTLENHLIVLPENLRKILTKFRCRNHMLPIRKGCFENVLKDMRICQFC